MADEQERLIEECAMRMFVYSAGETAATDIADWAAVCWRYAREFAIARTVIEPAADEKEE